MNVESDVLCKLLCRHSMTMISQLARSAVYVRKCAQKNTAPNLIEPKMWPLCEQGMAGSMDGPLSSGHPCMSRNGRRAIHESTVGPEQYTHSQAGTLWPQSLGNCRMQCHAPTFGAHKQSGSQKLE